MNATSPKSERHRLIKATPKASSMWIGISLYGALAILIPCTGAIPLVIAVGMNGIREINILGSICNIGFILFAGFACIFAAVKWIRQLPSARELDEMGTVSRGKIIDKWLSSGFEGGRNYNLAYKYQENYQARQKVNRSIYDSYNIGDDIDVLYLSKDPQVSRLLENEKNVVPATPSSSSNSFPWKVIIPVAIVLSLFCLCLAVTGTLVYLSIEGIGPFSFSGVIY